MWSNRRRSASVVAALLAAALATPSVAAPAETERTAAARTDPEKRVCRSVKVTGSQIRQRVCHRQKEWDRMREEAQEAMRKGGQRISDSEQQ